MRCGLAHLMGDLAHVWLHVQGAWGCLGASAGLIHFIFPLHVSPLNSHHFGKLQYLIRILFGFFVH